ncbi:AP2 domain-containing protein [Caballeronia sordidicola]|uniref:AP2 domain-containing protein n=1 Tax=Caballeronia sordidicola TaxID=196367 RepID=UPI000A3CB9D8|nr:AP2 domain-containing protein [Caballeronia sordidicola]
MKEIPLTQGKVAIVDDEDYEALSRHNWFAVRRRRKTVAEAWYAARMSRKDESSSPRLIYMHGQILEAPSGFVTAHDNHDGLDNRRVNLCVASPAKVAAHKRTKPRALPRGVRTRKKGRKLEAYITVSGRSVFVGLYHTPQEAADAYDAARVKHCGANFGTLNGNSREHVAD